MGSDYEVKECEVLIIGAGGAGLRAAIEAHDAGAKVILTCKSLLGKAHTVMAEGGIATAIGNVDPQDNWKVHFADTIGEGQFLGNYRMAEIFVKEASERVYELERWGALFDRTKEGKILQRPFGAHTYQRLCHIGDRTGLELIRTLQDQVLARNIEVMDEVMITNLLKNDGAIAGAVAIKINKGEFILFKTSSVILATGGCGRVYKVTSNSWESTGDGVALAYRAGAELMDMEMIQFHPTGMVYPEGVRGMLVTEAVRGEGGILLNAKGERFMKKYDPKRMELSARDVVARSIYTELIEGRGTPNGGVFLDITHRGADYIKRKLPSMYAQFLEFADIDITKDKMEVSPTVHYQMGGVRVEPETGDTSVKGLYAAGEVASGLHGANRLGGNSLSDILVFGRRAGKAAAEYSKKHPRVEINDSSVGDEIERALDPFNRKEGENPYSIQSHLQETMWKHVGIVRDAADLKTALNEIETMKKKSGNVSAIGSRRYNPGWLTCLDIENMLTVTEAIVRSALMREESRGAHTRSDFPGKDDAHWLRNIIIKSHAERMVLNTQPVPQMPPELASLVGEER